MSTVDNLKEQILDWQLEIKRIQDECTHKRVEKTPRCNDGGYDNSTSYWYNFFCKICHKRWTEPQ